MRGFQALLRNACLSKPPSSVRLFHFHWKSESSTLPRTQDIKIRSLAEGRMPPPSELPSYEFTIVEEQQLHRRYLTLYNRRIRFPSIHGKPEQEHEYDIIGHPQLNFSFVVVFPFHPYKDDRPGGEITILREHCQGLNDMLFTLPTGGFDPRKNASHLGAAQAELSEEAHLSGGQWVELLDPEHPGIAEVKWCRNRFRPFLCIDPQTESFCTFLSSVPEAVCMSAVFPARINRGKRLELVFLMQPDQDPGARDAEEFIEVHRVSVQQLRDMLTATDMLLPSMTTSFLALDRLQRLGHL